jgi:hypothetical protein
MRAVLFLVAWAICLFGDVGRSAAQDDVRSIIDKALKAHGGAERLAKVTSAQSKSKGTLHILDGFKYTSESFVQLPNQVKTVMQLEVNGMNITQIQILDGDKAWIHVNGKTEELQDKLLNEMKEGFYAERIASLTPLKDKEYQLSPLGSAKVDGREAVGVRVASKGHRDINLFFDKESGLLVKVEHRALDALTKQEVSQEEILSDYKDYAGIKRPGKALVLHDGKKFLDAEVTEFKIVDKFDPGVFAKP